MSWEALGENYEVSKYLRNDVTNEGLFTRIRIDEDLEQAVLTVERLIYPARV